MTDKTTKISEARLDELIKNENEALFTVTCTEMLSALRELKALRQENEWISVQDRMPEFPETSEPYVRRRYEVWQTFFENPVIGTLVTFRDGSHGWSLPNLSGDAKEYVTHWRPLPTPPAPRTEGK